MEIEIPICAKDAAEIAVIASSNSKRILRIVVFTCPIDSKIWSYVAQKSVKSGRKSVHMTRFPAIQLTLARLQLQWIKHQCRRSARVSIMS